MVVVLVAVVGGGVAHTRTRATHSQTNTNRHKPEQPEPCVCMWARAQVLVRKVRDNLVQSLQEVASIRLHIQVSVLEQGRQHMDNHILGTCMRRPKAYYLLLIGFGVKLTVKFFRAWDLKYSMWN